MSTPPFTLAADATASSSPGIAVPTHPIYTAFEPVWRRLAHVAEGTGGFLDGTFLVGHPREWQDFREDNPTKPTKKLKQRRKLARYENPARPILQTIQGVLFREGPSRRAGDPQSKTPHPLVAWWDDVDGTGRSIDEWWALVWPAAAIFGHIVIVMDRPKGQASTRAQAPKPYLRIYTPLDVPDWLLDDRNELAGAWLFETLPRTTLGTHTLETVIREVRPDGWTLKGKGGVELEKGAYDYQGKAPLVRLFSRRRALTADMGESVLGDPQLYVDVYNLTSEIRELLRNQTFSLLNVPLGVGQDALGVEQARAMLGESTGTENVIFSGLPIAFCSPDATQVQTLMAERDALLRTIYRLAGVPWEADSRDAESAASRVVKRDEFYASVGNFAQELQRADYQIAELFMRQEYGVAWEREWDAADVTIQWPTSFDTTTQSELEQATLALGLQFPKEALDAIKKSLIPKLLPTLSLEEQREIEAAIEAQEDPAEAEAKMREAKVTALTQGAPRSAGFRSPLNDDDSSPPKVPTNVQ